MTQINYQSYLCKTRGWSGGAMVLDKLPVPRRPTIWIIVGQGPTALAVGAGGGCLDIFTLIYPFSLLSPSLWETARYRLKYCLKGPLDKKKKQPTNQCKTHWILYQCKVGKLLSFTVTKLWWEAGGNTAWFLWHANRAIGNLNTLCIWTLLRGGRVVRWCWVNFQYRGVLQFGLQ